MIKKKLFLIIVLNIGIQWFLFSQNIWETKRSCHYVNTSTRSFIADIEQYYGIYFYYKDKWLNNSTVTVNGDSLNLKQILDQAFKYSQLSYMFEEPDLVILIENKNKIEKLPAFVYEPQETVGLQIVKKPQNSSKFLKGRRTDEKKIIVVGSQKEQFFGRKAQVTGKIFEQESNESLIGATLYLPEINYGTASNEVGEMKMQVAPGKYTAEFRCIGMMEEKCQLVVYSNGTFEFAMQKEVQALKEVTINANQDYKIRGSQVGLDKIDIKAVKELPSLMGERDIVKISQLLPGVVSVSEGSGGVNVRGGNADQNMLYVNQIPLYNTSHVFGFFTALNTSIIDDFSMYKGYVPTQYGGRLSSIFLVDSRKGNKKKFFAQGGISPISANAEVEGPIKKDKSSFVISGRSTYSDWIMQRLSNDDLRNSSVNFYDFAAGLDFEINPNNKLHIMGYGSHDFFNMNNLNEYSYDNLGFGANYIHRFNEKLKAQFTAVYSGYSFATQDWNSISEAYSHDYNLGHAEVKTVFNWNLSDKHSLLFGGGLINYELDRGTVKPIGQESDRRISDLGREHGIEGAVYVDETFQVAKWLKLQAGLRYSFFTRLGPENVNIYEPDGPPDTTRIASVESYGKGKLVANYGRPELRLTADFKTGMFSSIKLAYNEMSQYLFLLNSSFSINPTDQWKMADTYIKPGFAKQLSAGYYKTLPGLGITFSAESYLKKANNILEFKDGADFINTKQVETMTLQGVQDAYGMEFMIARDEGRLNGWISYTFSRSMMKVDGGNSWDKINQGMKYPSNFDKPHVANLVANLKFTRRLILSTTLVYSTGRPITLPQTIYYMEGIKYVDYSDRNEYRVPDYFRMDLSLTLEGNLKAKKPFHSYWMLNVYNMTGRKNPYSIYFQSEEGLIRGYQYSVIGVPVFTISWNFKLGNYANE